MTESDSNWSKEEFEDTIAKGLIACFESKILKNKSDGPDGRLDRLDLLRLRKIGPFFPGQDRVITESADKDGYMWFDVDNDPLPQNAIYSQTQAPLTDQWPDAYVRITLCRKIEGPLPKRWVRMSGGQLYAMHLYGGMPKGIIGTTKYFTVDHKGWVIPCDLRLPNIIGYRPGKKHIMLSQKDREPKILRQTSFLASVVLQYQADKRFTWSIRAFESDAKATLGCGKEQVKSLLYARSLPLTATGRKRPILHLVEAHQRRLKNGTDIDITSFLRGSQEIEMDGTLFKVMPPKVVQPTVSENSQRYYEEGI